MQAKKAEAIAKAWAGKPCAHPEFDKEYYLSMQTGDYVCTQCGRTFTPSEYETLSQRKNG